MILSEMLKNSVSVVKLNGKQPVEKGWQRWSDELRPMEHAAIAGNYGVVCGPASGLIVLDIDNADKFKSAGLETPTTAVVQTAKGYHLYFKYPGDGKQYRNAADQERGFDIRGHGGQVVGPGSVHPETKTKYEIVRDIEPVDAPAWLLEISGPKKAKQAEFKHQGKNGGDISPLDDYNQRTHPMDLLSGWQYNGKAGTWEGRKTDYIVRPGKDIKAGQSGSIIHTEDPACPLKFYNFSSNSGFEIEKIYTPADLYAEIHYGGDMNLTAKTLYEQGFGSNSSQLVTNEQTCHNSSQRHNSSQMSQLVTDTLNFFDAVCQFEEPIINSIYKRYGFHDAPTLEELEKRIFLDKDLNSFQKAYSSQLVTTVTNSSQLRHNSSQLSAGYNGIAGPVKDFIYQSSGIFKITDIYTALDLRSAKPKAAVRSIVHRLKEADQVESVGSHGGTYRLIERDANEIDFKNVSHSESNMILPFAMNEFVKIMPGNIIVFAGEQNAGKTALLLNIVKSNMQSHTCHYFSSEMGASEMNLRLKKFDGIKLNDWQFKAYERASEFADIIVPGEGNINIIDYLEMHTDFWRVAEHFAKIHNKLKGAIAVVAIQKDRDSAVGRGKSFSLEKPRLYCNVSPGRLEMYKAKNWATAMNPNGLNIDYTLAQGAVIVPAKDDYSGNVLGWYRRGEKDKKFYLKDER